MHQKWRSCSKKSSPTAVCCRWDYRTTKRRKARGRRISAEYNCCANCLLEMFFLLLSLSGADSSEKKVLTIRDAIDMTYAPIPMISQQQVCQRLWTEVNTGWNQKTGGTHHGCPHIVACLFTTRSAELRVHLRPEQPSCCSCHLQLLVRTRRIMNLADKKKKMFRLAPPRRLNASFVW